MFVRRRLLEALTSGARLRMPLNEPTLTRAIERALSPEAIELFTRPVTMPEASGEWITAREARDIVATTAKVTLHEAEGALFEAKRRGGNQIARSAIR